MPVQIVITKLKDQYYKVSIHSRAKVIETYEGGYIACLEFVQNRMKKLDALDQ
jgi:hypothetical protein